MFASYQPTVTENRRPFCSRNPCAIRTRPPRNASMIPRAQKPEQPVVPAGARPGSSREAKCPQRSLPPRRPRSPRPLQPREAKAARRSSNLTRGADLPPLDRDRSGRCFAKSPHAAEPRSSTVHGNPSPGARPFLHLNAADPRRRECCRTGCPTFPVYRRLPEPSSSSRTPGDTRP